MDEFTIKLSEREEQCLYCAALDLSLEETALKMKVGYETIKSYRRFVLRKLNRKTMGGAVYRGLQLNLFTLE